MGTNCVYIIGCRVGPWPARPWGQRRRWKNSSFIFQKRDLSSFLQRFWCFDCFVGPHKSLYFLLKWLLVWILARPALRASAAGEKFPVLSFQNLISHHFCIGFDSFDCFVAPHKSHHLLYPNFYAVFQRWLPVWVLARPALRASAAGEKFLVLSFQN